MTTQQTDALQCAADLEYSIPRHRIQDAFILNAYKALKMVRTQHARIADLEAQLEATAQAEESVPAPAPPPECETEAEKRAFAFGWFKALESERMNADNKKKDPL